LTGPLNPRVKKNFSGISTPLIERGAREGPLNPRFGGRFKFWPAL